MLKTRAGRIIGNTPDTSDERLIRMKELKLLTGLGRSTIHRLISQGRFPPPLHPFGHDRLSAWRYSQVAAWIQARCRGEIA
jgi:prophage regulatory protein